VPMALLMPDIILEFIQNTMPVSTLTIVIKALIFSEITTTITQNRTTDLTFTEVFWIPFLITRPKQFF
jgi:hypothetical protein